VPAPAGCVLANRLTEDPSAQVLLLHTRRYAGRAGTGMPEVELERLWQRLQPLVVDKMPLAEPPPRGTRFGSPLVLTRIHWVRPEMVVEVSYAEWTPDGLLRHVVYLGQRQDKLAAEVRRRRSHAGEP
jgi:ATP-dependent DNA ligase